MRSAQLTNHYTTTKPPRPALLGLLIGLVELDVRGDGCRVPRTLDRPGSACYPDVRGGTTWDNNARKVFQNNGFHIIKHKREHFRITHGDGMPLEGSHRQGLHGCVTPPSVLLFRSPHPALKFHNCQTRATGLVQPRIVWRRCATRILNSLGPDSASKTWETDASESAPGFFGSLVIS